MKIAENDEAIQRSHERMKELDSETSCSDEKLDAVCDQYADCKALTYAAELKKVAQLQKQWALRKPTLDAHCLALQKEILKLEQEIDELVMEKLSFE